MQLEYQLPRQRSHKVSDNQQHKHLVLIDVFRFSLRANVIGKTKLSVGLFSEAKGVFISHPSQAVLPANFFRRNFHETQ